MGAATRSVEDVVAGTGIRFLFDENIPAAFAESLRLVGYQVVSTTDLGLRRAPDEDIIRYCAAKKLVWVTKDLDSRKKDAYTGLVKELRVSVVFLVSPVARHWTMRQQFEAIVRHLGILEAELSGARGPRYYVCRSRGSPRAVSSFASRPGR